MQYIRPFVEDHVARSLDFIPVAFQLRGEILLCAKLKLDSRLGMYSLWCL